MSATARDPDVVIVGAGIMGLALAWALAKRNRRVLCIERGRLGRQASAATAGTLAVQNKPLASVPLTLWSLKIWQRLDAELGRSVEYEVRGGLRVAHTDEDLDKLARSASAQRAAGAPVEMLSRQEALAMAPYLSPDIGGAAFCALDAMANPFAAVRALFVACRRAGVRFQFDRPAVGVDPQPDGTVRVATSREPGSSDAVSAGTVVIAAGAWIPEVAASTGVLLPIVARVQQVLITDGDAPELPHVVTHVRGNLTLKQQRVTRKVLVGGGWPGTGDSAGRVRRLFRESIVGNARMAVATVPALAQARLLRAWTGFEGRTPDKLPVIGPLSVANLHVLGCAAGGFTIAPAAGELLARHLCGEPAPVPLEPFSPLRFQASAPWLLS